MNSLSRADGANSPRRPGYLGFTGQGKRKSERKKKGRKRGRKGGRKESYRETKS